MSIYAMMARSLMRACELHVAVGRPRRCDVFTCKKKSQIAARAILRCRRHGQPPFEAWRRGAERPMAGWLFISRYFCAGRPAPSTAGLLAFAPLSRAARRLRFHIATYERARRRLDSGRGRRHAAPSAAMQSPLERRLSMMADAQRRYAFDITAAATLLPTPPALPRPARRASASYFRYSSRYIRLLSHGAFHFEESRSRRMRAISRRCSTMTATKVRRRLCR